VVRQDPGGEGEAEDQCERRECVFPGHERLLLESVGRHGFPRDAVRVSAHRRRAGGAREPP
jgi:hypothetical protein